MQIKDVTDYLGSVFPVDKALEYDNPGLLCGDDSKVITGCVISLDCTTKAAELAKKNGFNLIVTHHPLIFGGINNVAMSNATGRILSSIIRNDIAYYACHTNLDLTDEFGNLAIAQALGAEDAQHCEGCDCGVVFMNKAEMPLYSFMKLCMRKLNCSGTITINNQSNVVRKVFVQGGALDEASVPSIIASGADTVVSGEIKHHITVLLEENGINSVIAGHSATEQVYLPKLEKLLEDKFPQVRFIVNNNNESCSVL